MEKIKVVCDTAENNSCWSAHTNGHYKLCRRLLCELCALWWNKKHI